MSADDVARRLSHVRSEIDSTRRRWNHPVEIVAVTKGFGPEVIRDAVTAGCTAVGENYAQELRSKHEVIESLGPEVHFIGQLQTNKVRMIADTVDVWSTLDRPSVVREVAKRAPGARVLVQVDTTDEPGKGGCPPDRVADLVASARDQGLRVEGLMTVGPTDRPAEAAREGFQVVRSLVDDLGLEVCSMGMSGDLPIALEEGTTSVRLGTALFGPRSPRRPA